MDRAGLLKLCSAQIRKIAYIAPQNSDVGFDSAFCERGSLGVRSAKWQGGSG
jgi:hypothetical protein